MALKLVSRKLDSRLFPMFSSTTQLDSHATSFGDELLFDSFPYKKIENGMLWEVEGKILVLILLLRVQMKMKVLMTKLSKLWILFDTFRLQVNDIFNVMTTTFCSMYEIVV